MDVAEDVSVFGRCEHRWKETGRHYYPPRGQAARNLGREELEMVLLGATTVSIQCELCGKRQQNVYVGQIVDAS